MFGYLRIFKPRMRFCEYDTYKAVYCGLCKLMGKKYGITSRFTLSYDFTFLTLLNLSLSDCDVIAKKERCIAHPLKKSVCMHCDNGLEYPATSAVLLTYHKLHDDLSDKGLKKKITAVFFLPFAKKAYKKASQSYPKLSEILAEQMSQQNKLEQERCKSLDRSAEPTAVMTQEIFRLIGNDDNQKRVLARLGYLLGRYIYFCDALDDVRKDYKTNSYNPLLLRNEIKTENGEISDETMKDLRDEVATAVNLTLAELANTYVLLDFKRYKDILDNIVYLGLKNTFTLIINEKINKKEKSND